MNVIKSKQLFILIGDDRTGKTTLQKLLLEKISNEYYDRLHTNKQFDIKHPEIKRKYKNISFANRSYQEKMAEYGNVEDYFNNYFNPADISIISSHLNINDITQMIEKGKERFYNVTGVFFTNSIDKSPSQNADISKLNWDERLVIENKTAEKEETIKLQLNAIADNFVIFIANRTSIS